MDPKIEVTKLSGESCELCEHTERPASFCVDCGLSFCESCWSENRSHAPGIVNSHGVPHEKIDRAVAFRLKQILTPPSDPEVQRELYENDAQTTWFGVSRDARGAPVLQDYGRYSTIMRESTVGEFSQRWPQLVSFVGQTGAGKSTLIQLLIDYEGRAKNIPGHENFPLPVMGASNDARPTSGDVHLYADPGTYSTREPILYADCEGTNQGESVPRGAMYKHTNAGPSPDQKNTQHKTTKSTGGLPARRGISAVSSEKNTREFVVQKLYSRILYAFSDVIVLAIRNQRTFDSHVLPALIQWAVPSTEGTLNQSALPHVIIVSNCIDPDTHPGEYNVESATERLLASASRAMGHIPILREHAQYWRAKGREILTAEQLLLCYYSSVSVVGIPRKGRYALLNEQVAKLNAQIKRRCDGSRQTKKRSRLTLNAEELQAALSVGFDHFSRSLDEPFDFMETLFKLNPTSNDFGGNVLRLALAIRKSKMTGASGPEIFQHLGPMVASCVMLDYVRHHIKGTPRRLLLHYRESCNRALKEFCEFWWPCEFHKGALRCVNISRGHLKGHQDFNGRVLGAGPYRSSFTENSFQGEWQSILNDNLDDIRRQIESLACIDDGTYLEEEERAAETIHLRRMNEFYASFGDLSACMNHSACFCCLRELPEHPLPCGHVLCTSCFISFGRRKNRMALAMDFCPLHSEQKWPHEWEIAVKPRYAGVRVLTLDGGGVRGIVELLILDEIQKYLGGVPVASFFDLIMGTNMGGLIALGLGTKNWSVERSTYEFQNICREAFAPREFAGIPILQKIVTLNYGGKYKTKPFEMALKRSFQDDQLFGGASTEQKYRRKVAVVSATDFGRGAVVLSNYNRLELPIKQEYKFERPESVSAELKVWEAARATSATPGFFKPFENIRTGLKYIDGSIYYKNPASVAECERKLLWPDVKNQPPDIFLSIGTSVLPRVTNIETKEPSRRFPGAQVFSELMNSFNDTLNAQKVWDDFYDEVRESSSISSQRYVRLNPELPTDWVKIDNIRHMDELRLHVKGVLRSPKWQEEVKSVSHRLIASSFFFEEIRMLAYGNEDVVEGRILCRFPDKSVELRDLGRKLQELQSVNFSPHFVTTEHGSTDRRDIISTTVVRSMIEDSVFTLDEVLVRLPSITTKATISLYLSVKGEAYPISGFPRHLHVQRERRVEWNASAELVAPKQQACLDIHIPQPFSDEGYDSWDSDVSDDDIPQWARRKPVGPIPSRILIKEEDTESSDSDLEEPKLIPRSMEQAIGNRDLEKIQSLLQHSFGAVATGEFEWLNELKELGYSNSEIAELLLDSERDSPWIFFERKDNPKLEMNPSFHHIGCPHSRSLSSQHPSTSSPRDDSLRIIETDQSFQREADENSLLFLVDEACGLAGICPNNRNLEDWPGKVDFVNSAGTSKLYASVTYRCKDDHEASSTAPHLDITSILECATRALNVLTRLCSIIGECQRRGLCCDCFTVLCRQSYMRSNNLEMHEVKLWHVAELSERLRELEKIRHADYQGTSRNRNELMKQILYVSERIQQEFGIRRFHTYVSLLEVFADEISLTLQLLTLGFALFARAHVGPFHPFFLDTPLHEISLWGASQMESGGAAVYIRLYRLTCLDGMIQSAVMAFDTASPESVKSGALPAEPTRLDLEATSTNLLYTWGPGQFNTRLTNLDTDTHKISGLLIGGGVILHQSPSTKRNRTVVHWQSTLPAAEIMVGSHSTWDPNEIVTIAGGTSINKTCRNDPKLQWPLFVESLENLGTHAGYWRLTEIQGGLAVNGQMFAGAQLQYNKTWAWQEQNTWKQNFLGMMSLDIPFEELERPWGLQVSYCTGLARRVPLRALLAEVMPVFVKTISVATQWQELMNLDTNIIEAFEGPDLTKWVNDLSLLPNSEKLLSLVKRIVLYVLLILKDTGIDRTNKLFRIACPEDLTSDRPIFMCLQVSCEKDNLWARILADSKDCATFAYMTRSCLESDDKKCQSTSPWHCTSLDTAVCRYRAQNDLPSLQSSPWQLRDRALYWIGRPESGLQARVRKLPNDPHPKLYVSISAMSEKTLARLGTLKLLSKMGKRTDHIREKQYDHMEGEGVLILTELKS